MTMGSLSFHQLVELLLALVRQLPGGGIHQLTDAALGGVQRLCSPRTQLPTGLLFSHGDNAQAPWLSNAGLRSMLSSFSPFPGAHGAPRLTAASDINGTHAGGLTSKGIS